MMCKKILLYLCALVTAVFTCLSLSSTKMTVFAWGDNSENNKGRPFYTKAEIDTGALGDKITFNSISDNTALGTSEKYFVATRKYNDTDTSHKWQAGSITVEDGGEYVIRMYVHNNSPKGYNAIAKDVRSFFKIPGTSARSVRVVGYLDSSNATPTEYWDEVEFKSDNLFHLEYVGGSALIDNKGVGKNGGAKLSDEIVTNKKGVLLGYDSLNGEIPGCFEYDSIVTIRVKAYFDRSYAVTTKVRLVGDTDKSWKKEVDAQEGDKVEYQIEYRNTGDTTQNNVIIDADLPSNLRAIPGTTKLYDVKNNGFVFDGNSIIDNGVLIGNYAADSNALVRFTVKVVDDDFTCGKFILHTWGRATVGQTVIQDSAAVNVQLAYCPDPKIKILKYISFILFVLIVLCILLLIIISRYLRRFKR